MNSLFERLNLRPQEQRFIVFVSVIAFVALNLWLVWPHFGDGNLLKTRIAQAEKNLRKYTNEIARLPQYQADLKKLENSGTAVASEEQAQQLVRLVQLAVQTTGVTVRNWGTVQPASRQKEGFFDESSLQILAEGDDKQIVDFLVNLASGASIIRVKYLTLKTDPSQTKLIANITFIASYQKPPKKAPTVSPTRSGQKAYRLGNTRPIPRKKP